MTNQQIVLATLNARYIHSAFGLRYLQANLGERQDDCVIEEFTLQSRPQDVVEQILVHQPAIVGFGVYIWNIEETERVIAILKAVAPETVVVLGGPEVSYEYADQPIVSMADYLITGWGDVSFAQLVESLFAGQPPADNVIAGEQPKLTQLNMPYRLYSDEDIANRVIYVEASRGCPFKCEFCLSALDKTAWPFDLELFLAEMDILYRRGARHFKFVDRTFNLKIKSSLQILDFFLERMDEELFLHFEVIPDHLPQALKQKISAFPPGSLQFEVGIQTFNPDVQALISRKQNNQQATDNLQWLREHCHAHIHADLIFGLPGEDLKSFARSFDALYALRPHEIQVGILKRLKGSPIVRHAPEYKLVFNPNPPFNILSSTTVNYQEVQELGRFARYWDLLGNSGRFSASLPLLLEEQPFAQFWRLSQMLYQRTGQTYKISLLRLFDLVFDIATQDFALDAMIIREAIQDDFSRSGLKSVPRCLGQQNAGKSPRAAALAGKKHNSRQIRH